MIFKFRWKPDDATLHLLYQYKQKLSSLEDKIMTLNEAITALTAKVADQGTVIEGAITLMGNLSAQLAAVSTAPAALQAIIDTLEASKTALQTAVTTNTPAP